MKKTKENQNLIKKFLPWVMIMLIAIVAMVVFFWYYKSNTAHKIGIKTYNFSMGLKQEYSTDMKLKFENGATQIVDKNTIVSDGTPLVVEGVKQLILPVSMGYTNPDMNTGVSRVNYFSTVTLNNSGFTIVHNDISTKVDGGFLYDGKGTYIFLEKFEIKVGSAKYQLEPLSYVKDFYKNSVEIYDVCNDNYQYIVTTDADVIATSEKGYSINLGTCVMATGDTQRILFSNIDAMGVLK